MTLYLPWSLILWGSVAAFAIAFSATWGFVLATILGAKVFL